MDANGEVSPKAGERGNTVGTRINSPGTNGLNGLKTQIICLLTGRKRDGYAFFSGYSLGKIPVNSLKHLEK